ncbi:hypothetical protein [Burkholderia cenocepacia]|uniref:hypothetical protein n=1 Tax=Burkholderia cenocepacia TaxID=95486 RepID=UPI00076BE486|nr:hypothetical protein [Burkholderia cenocepacia]KWU26278.1 hypothetical protein AS149_25135 [Burkholderia cenocepacia]
MQSMPTPVAAFLFLLVFCVGVKLLALVLQTAAFQSLLRRLSGEGNGEFVAEVRLMWFFGPGSVLYRQRFNCEGNALKAAKRQARILDNWLPRFYYDTDASGSRIELEHEYGISYGVRRVTESEHTEFVALDERTLPGY